MPLDIIIKINTVNCTQIQQHFDDCNFAVTSMSLQDYSTKLREFGTTVEAWCGNDLEGLCVCYINNYDTHVAFISHIAINPDQKRKGIGRSLISTTKSIAVNKGFKSIRLEVKKTNESAVAFYNTLGFNLINSDEDKLLMELQLI